MQSFTNDTLDLELLPKYQDVVFLPIHKKYWNVMLLNTFIFSVLVFVATMFLFLVVLSEDNSSEFYVMILALALFLVGFSFLRNRIAFKKRAYAVREKDVLYRRGVLSTTTTIIPMNRIQHIAVNEGIFSRMYGLASLEIYTAGGNSSDLSIVGIEREKAHNIKDFLMNNINMNQPNSTFKP